MERWKFTNRKKMGCWGSGIGQDDGFLDDLFHIQNELQWRGYKDNLEYITAQHFNENCHLISEKIAKGFPLNENSCYSCWFQVLAHLVMKIGGSMSLEMKQQCMLASRPENDYQDPGAWFKEESLL